MVDTNASKGNIPAQGYRDIYPLHTASPLILPRSAAWNGINIEHHIQPPAECKLCLPQHTICILLREGKLPLSAIASKVGFFDQSHFTRAFKRIVGLTPQALLQKAMHPLPKAQRV